MVTKYIDHFDIAQICESGQCFRMKKAGEKAADCICLFALHQMEAFPVDTHISRAL